MPRCTALSLLLVLLAAGLLCGQPQSLTTVVNNGSSNNRVDLVVIAEGYTAAEQGKFNADVQNLVQAFFAEEPYREYQRYFNVHRLNVISNQSGADHPEYNPPVSRDTYFGAAYNCAGIDRLICANNPVIDQVLSVWTQPNRRDIVVLLVNDPAYGGSGGAVAIASTHSSVVELVLHEVGHSFGLLADEYAGGGPACNPNVEPVEPNATRANSLPAIKWNYWISPGTAIPTTTPLPAFPGLYEGSKYCNTGLYRATFDSKMRSLDRRFEQINEEQHVKRVYNLVSPIDSASPAATTQQINQAQSLLFSVSTPVPLTHSLNIQWLVDGAPRSNSADFLLQGSALTVGNHTVIVNVSDTTPFVRRDPAALLRSSRAWTVTIQPAPGGATVTKAGVFSNGIWLVDLNGNYAWNGVPTDASFSFQMTGTPVVGDWDGTGRQKTGIFNNGVWRLDFNGNHNWDGPVVDREFQLGWPGAIPVVGDWNGDGRTKIGVYSNGSWFLDYNGNGQWEGGGVDKQIPWGWGGATPVVGDWNGDGKTEIGVYSGGFWFLDYNGDFMWNTAAGDKQVGWGWAGAQIVTGDWNGNGKTKIGVYSAGFWFLDYDGDYVWNPSAGDKQVGWGWAGAQIVTGDWNGDGKTKIGAVNQGFWFLDYDGNYVWDGGVTDKIAGWGAPGDAPVPGKW